MNSLQDSIATWATILGTVVSLIGMIQSRVLLTIIGLLSIGGSIGGLVVARNRQLMVESASTKIEGRSIDSLNIANLQRSVNRNLFVQAVDRVTMIKGQDLNIDSHYSGYCRVPSAESIEFSIDTDNNVPFARLDCFAYDLRNDPDMHHKIRPMLIGADGNSKKVAVPFLRPLASQQVFSVRLICYLPGCMKSGVEYYAAALSFDQPSIGHSSVKLIFVGNQPEWLRVYEASGSCSPKLVNNLAPQVQRPGYAEYQDDARNVNARSSKIYVFFRS